MREKNMDHFDYVILGGGMVAGYAAKALAEQGLQSGRLAIISPDDVLPYERPPLSKGYLGGRQSKEETLINPDFFYRDNQIEVRLLTAIKQVDLKRLRLTAHSGDEIDCEKLLIATGARPHTLDQPGSELRNIFYLRSMGDSDRIREAAKQARHAVVIGSGFIGMEVAAVLTQQGLKTTMVFPEDRVWAKRFTPETSTFFARYYGDRGVTLLANSQIAAFEGSDRVQGIVLKSGQRISADLVVAGIGVTPVTDILARTEVELENGVLVNEFLETSVQDVYAAGDVANYWDVLFGRRRRVEHWDNAVEQGKHVARVLAGDREPFVHVPYFFSDVFDLSYEFWGDPSDFDQTIHRGDLESGKFSVWWTKGDRLVAAFVMNRPDEERELAPEWIRAKTPVDVGVLYNPARPLRGAPRA
jgi:NADPH-dependent 2,4-dienoyl-CoA reductase/sulfur reductase-like enzyme